MKIKSIEVECGYTWQPEPYHALKTYVRVGATLDAGDDVHEAVADLVRAAALDIAGSIEPLENMHTAARKEMDKSDW